MIDAARATLITEHLALVRPLAVRAWRRGRAWPLDDLVAAGQFGLVDAASRFDPAVCARPNFASFAQRRIRGAIIDEIRRGALVGGPYRPGRSYEATYVDLADAAGVLVHDVVDSRATPERRCIDASVRAAGHARIRRGLAGLSRTNRDLLIDRYAGGQTWRAMARARGVTEPVVWRRHARVLAVMRRAR